MIEALNPPVRGLILDGDGVLWRDAEPVGNLAAVFGALRAHGLRASIATNNAMNTVEDYCRKLDGFGVKFEADQIVTAAEATADTLLSDFPNRGAVYLAGEAGVRRALVARGFDVVTDPKVEATFVAVVAGIDREFTYSSLARASSLARSGLPYYGTNPDPTFPTANGLAPGAGSIVAAVTTAAGKAPIVVGKPSPLLFEMAAMRMGLAAADILVVGDRLETDIQGGQAFGARTALVLSGVSTQNEADAWRPPPTLIAATLSTLLGL